MPQYLAPTTTELSEVHVRDALDFLVAIEPIPTAATREQYDAAVAPYVHQVPAAMATLRAFADRPKPMTLQQMQVAYYGFTGDPRYLVSAEVSGVVTGSLNAAWAGVGPWRR